MPIVRGDRVADGSGGGKAIRWPLGAHLRRTDDLRGFPEADVAAIRATGGSGRF
jgi:hypothetical protein